MALSGLSLIPMKCYITVNPNSRLQECGLSYGLHNVRSHSCKTVFAYPSTPVKCIPQSYSYKSLNVRIRHLFDLDCFPFSLALIRRAPVLSLGRRAVQWSCLCIGLCRLLLAFGSV